MNVKEIKFRGQKIYTKEWVYGYYYYDGKISYINAPFEHVHEVDAETVGEFLVLKDRNGKEIYKDDFIKDSEEMYLVKFGEYEDSLADGTLFGWYLQHVDSGDTYFLYNETDQLEITGNIHQHPELLTQLNKP